MAIITIFSQGTSCAQGSNSSTSPSTSKSYSWGNLPAPTSKKSDSAQKLLDYIKSVQRQDKTIAGQMDLTWNPATDMAGRVYKDTGKYPALMGYDFMNYTQSSNNTNQTAEAIAWAEGTYKYDEKYSGRKGGIVTFCWHWRNPLSPDKKTGSQDNFYSEGTTFRIPKSEDSAEFKAIKKDLDKIAAELKKLKDEDIPVLWRPLHEAAGGWFWWGDSTKKGYLALWRYMYHYFTEEKGLDNLIWVWNGQSPSWYPGDEYCDIIAWDEYDASKIDGDYEILAGMKKDKPIAMSENGRIPENPWEKWAYFMTWNDNPYDSNTDFWSSDKLNPNRKKIYADSRVITLENLEWKQ